MSVRLFVDCNADGKGQVALEVPTMGRAPKVVCAVCRRMAFRAETPGLRIELVPVIREVRHSIRLGRAATTCDARCQGARGRTCDCECAGQFHGTRR